jgi:predicted AlkP superfamily pyrophosphatase or phosphodiesterase
VAPVRSARLVPCLLTATLALGCEGRQAESAEHGRAAASDSGSTVTHEPKPEPPKRPKLVVVVVIDQMRFDYFDHYGPQWQHGFVRLREESQFFTAAYHDHALTETAPGHATLSTGTHPSQHGIVANNWFDRSRGLKVEAVEDRSVKLLGNDTEPGMSPATLLRESVGDWMQAADPR